MMNSGIFFAVCFVTVHTNPTQEWKKTLIQINEKKCGNPQSLSYRLVDFAEIERIEPNLDYDELRNVSDKIF